jgi:hypothetical protein
MFLVKCRIGGMNQRQPGIQRQWLGRIMLDDLGRPAIIHAIQVAGLKRDDGRTVERVLAFPLFTGAPAQNGAKPDDQEHRDPRENNNTD